MKKIISLALLLITIMISLCACGNDATSNSVAVVSNAKVMQSEYFDVKVVDEGDAYAVIVDKNTGVMYVVIGGYTSGAMSPIYNADGSVKTMN